MGKVRTGLPEVWPSGLAKWIVGGLTCGWAIWFRSHHTRFDKAPSDFDKVAWNAGHKALVAATKQQLELDGWKVREEGQNFFRIRGATAVLCGKPDLVATKRGVTKVVDCKYGQERPEHAAQVAIYMIALPMAWNDKLHVTGEVVYPTHAVPVEPNVALELKPKVFGALREIGGAPMAKVPSAADCRFCDIAKTECPERVEETPAAAEVATTLF